MGWAAAALVVAVAGALRLAHLGQVVGDPFYDGAVRSMALSWHNFFFGAVEPSGAVAIDKRRGPVAAGRWRAGARLSFTTYAELPGAGGDGVAL